MVPRLMERVRAMGISPSRPTAEIVLFKGPMNWPKTRMSSCAVAVNAHAVSACVLSKLLQCQLPGTHGREAQRLGLWIGEPWYECNLDVPLHGGPETLHRRRSFTIELAAQVQSERVWPRRTNNLLQPWRGALAFGASAGQSQASGSSPQ